MSNLDLYFEDYLAHYGVKGMKWGVRKSRRQRRLDARAARREAAGKKPRKTVSDRRASAGQKRADAAGRVSRGEAAVSDYLLTSISAYGLMGLTRRGSARLSRTQQARADRMRQGEATVRDILFSADLGIATSPAVLLLRGGGS